MDLFDGMTWGGDSRPPDFLQSPEDLSLPDRLRLAGFELILQGCSAWLYGAVYEAATIVAARTTEVPIETARTKQATILSEDP